MHPDSADHISRSIFQENAYASSEELLYLARDFLCSPNLCSCANRAATSIPNCANHVFCSVALHAHAGTVVVAASAGALEAASAADRSHGVGFWIATPGSGRLAYGPLATYAHGIVPGITVTAGQQLGTTAGTLALGWTQYDVSVNPWPLLTAVRPTD